MVMARYSTGKDVTVQLLLEVNSCTTVCHLLHKVIDTKALQEGPFHMNSKTHWKWDLKIKNAASPGEAQSCGADPKLMNWLRRSGAPGLWQAGWQQLLDITKWPWHVF